MTGEQVKGRIFRDDTVQPDTPAVKNIETRRRK